MGEATMIVVVEAATMTVGVVAATAAVAVVEVATMIVEEVPMMIVVVHEEGTMIGVDTVAVAAAVMMTVGVAVKAVTIVINSTRAHEDISSVSSYIFLSFFFFVISYQPIRFGIWKKEEEDLYSTYIYMKRKKGGLFP